MAAEVADHGNCTLTSRILNQAGSRILDDRAQSFFSLGELELQHADAVVGSAGRSSIRDRSAPDAPIDIFLGVVRDTDVSVQ